MMIRFEWIIYMCQSHAGSVELYLLTLTAWVTVDSRKFTTYRIELCHSRSGPQNEYHRQISCEPLDGEFLGI